MTGGDDEAETMTTAMMTMVIHRKMMMTTILLLRLFLAPGRYRDHHDPGRTRGQGHDLGQRLRHSQGDRRENS